MEEYNIEDLLTLLLLHKYFQFVKHKSTIRKYMPIELKPFEHHKNAYKIKQSVFKTYIYLKNKLKIKVKKKLCKKLISTY